MIGSAIEGEDIVQDTLAKAYYALPTLKSTANLRGWLFRIAHNKALDHLRQTNHQPSLEKLDEYLLVAEPDQPFDTKALAAVALSAFMKLAPKQRSCVILKDVLGYSLAEISEFLDVSIPAIKAALHRGRTRLRDLSKDIKEDIPATLDDQQQALLADYIDRFNARDFDAVRLMLADEVRVDLLVRSTEPEGYFYRYEHADDWQMVLGLVEDRPAILVCDPQTKAPTPTHFMLLTWQDKQVSRIRDYYYTRYVIQEAQIAFI